MEDEKILIIQLADPETEPEKCIAGLIFARTLAVMEDRVYVFSMAKSPLLYVKNIAENPRIDKKFKDLIAENLADLLKSSPTIYICSKSKELLSLEEDMLIQPFQIAGMLTLHNLKQTVNHTYFF
ncbi:MAG: DsrE family protein [Deltaproteobacteria bacterium]|jgi:predicted peroxiredoxin|nr:DsrE family protein [Deltaproteobacteria bacterium]MCL5879525.1 DsrE family protein [Deltaproteobacteria bacterium]MDA8305096.1 DsrE family protein [Deltaproteobacteria bacterium]